MAAGLLALLDDVATIAKIAASSLDDVAGMAGRASIKTAGVVIDDTAVTPQYLESVTPDRELPIVKQIALGSIRNKLIIILPVALLLSQFLPQALPVVLMCGGTYLAYEGAEKVWAKFLGHAEDEPAFERGPGAEKRLVNGAVRTDLILSTEIMVVALNEVTNLIFWQRLIVLILVAIAMTVVVYGFVGALVKMDDVGLVLSEKGRLATTRALGRGMVAAMPKILAVIAVVGTIAMLWVGGHILMRSWFSLGWETPWNLLERPVEAAREATGALGGVVAWLVETAGCAVVGLVAGSLVLLVVGGIARARGKSEHALGAAPA